MNIPKEQVHEVLVAARALIDTPEKWTKKFSARTADGTPVRSTDPTACKFCSVGAVDRIVESRRTGYPAPGLLFTEVIEVLQPQTPRGSVIGFNDDPETTHDQVLALFDAAIERTAS